MVQAVTDQVWHDVNYQYRQVSSMNPLTYALDVSFRGGRGKSSRMVVESHPGSLEHSDLNFTIQTNAVLNKAQERTLEDQPTSQRGRLRVTAPITSPMDRLWEPQAWPSMNNVNDTCAAHGSSKHKDSRPALVPAKDIMGRSPHLINSTSPRWPTINTSGPSDRGRSNRKVAGSSRVLYSPYSPVCRCVWYRSRPMAHH